jgi:SAM-dependent methyltransferase
MAGGLRRRRIKSPSCRRRCDSGKGEANMMAMVNDCTQGVLDGDQLAALLGVRPEALPAACLQTLQAKSLGYEILTGHEREEQLLRALRGSEAEGLRVSGPHRAMDWERGWDENLREFVAAGGAADALVPKYNHHRVLRWRGDYVRVDDAGFEYTAYTALRHHYFRRHFAGLRRVVEFGCGTGTSLMLLAESHPHLQLLGLDWAESSQRILQQLSLRTGRTIEGRRFDMFEPGGDLPLGEGTGVLTSAALEQIGDRHGPLLDRLLAGRPSVCVHIEPLLELYDEQSLFDDVARRYHLRRNYLRGFLPRLQELERQGRIEILELRRTGLGSFFHEGYGVVVWRPCDAPRRRG